MLRNTNFEPGSEADHSNFSFPKEDKIEVEGMKDEHTNEVAPRAVENINMQEAEGVNNAVLNFNMDFPNIDITNKHQMREIQSHIVEAYEENHEAGKALLQLLNAEVAKQLPAVQNKEVEDLITGITENLHEMTMEDIDKGIAKGHAA
jgi:hypothetical protein